MPIQPENTVSPLVLPEPPKDKNDLLKWAQDLSLVFSQSIRPLLNQFNLHINQTYAHPKSWANLRVSRPSFRTNPSDTTQIIVDASATKPARFVIGSTSVDSATGKAISSSILFESTSTLAMDMDLAGPGGLRSGLSKTASTIYYLYAVKNGSVAALLGDTNDPATGPSGYSDWTYLGAFISDASGNPANDFYSVGGIACWGISTTGHQVTVNSSTITAITLLVPTTAKHVMIQTGWSAVNAASDALSFSGIVGSAQAKHIAGTTTVSNTQNLMFIQAIPTAKTIYAKVTTTTTDSATMEPFGWIENPTEFK